MATEIEKILDDCISRIRNGELLNSVLDDYSEHRDTLKPLLSLVTDLYALETPQSAEDKILSGKQRMLNQLSTESPIQAKRGEGGTGYISNWISQIKLAITNINSFFKKENMMFRKPIVVLTLVLTMLFGGGAITAAAAQNALPGDFIYPVKTTIEDLRINATWDTQDEARLSIIFAGNRLEEIFQLVSAGRDDDVVLGLEEFERNLRLALESLSVVAKNDPAAARELTQLLSDLLEEQSQLLANMPGGAPDDIQTALRDAMSSAQKRLNLSDDDNFNGGNTNSNDDNTNDDDVNSNDDNTNANANNNDDNSNDDDDNSNTNSNDDNSNGGNTNANSNDDNSNDDDDNTNTNTNSNNNSNSNSNSYDDNSNDDDDNSNDND